MCTLNVTHYIFDDPCSGFSKYLEVQFECITIGKYGYEMSYEILDLIESVSEVFLPTLNAV